MTKINVSNAMKRYGEYKVLNEISLMVESGEIVGLLGPSGSGKTTLVNAIIGMTPLDYGDIQVCGMKIPNTKVMKKIGFMSQGDALYGDLSGFDNLIFFSRLNGYSKKEASSEAQEILELVDLIADKNKKVYKYSGGMKRRLSLAIALMNKPELLILDEPTVGIDPVLRRVFWSEFERRKTNGAGILLTTHVMDEAEKCDRLGLIREGKLIAFNTPSEIKRIAGKETIEEAFIELSSKKGE